MRYAITVDVDVPRDHLVTLVDDPVLLPRWHDGLVSATLEEPGPDAASRTRRVYDINGHELTIIEDVLARDLPRKMTCLLSVHGSCAEVRHEFEALGAQATRWTQHVDIAFTGPGLASFGAMMPGALARRTRRQMRALKLLAEGVEEDAPVGA